MGGEGKQLCWNWGCPGWKINYDGMRTWEQDEGMKRVKMWYGEETVETGNQRTAVQPKIKKGGEGRRVTIKDSQQTSITVTPTVAETGISSGCTTAQVSEVKHVFVPQSASLCRRWPKRKKDRVLLTGRQHGLQLATQKSFLWSHRQEQQFL